MDVYAFGVLLFELMTGQKPIAGDSVERIFYSILNEPLDLEPLCQAGVPQPVSDLVAACTAKKPADRPQGFGSICRELERVIADDLDAATRGADAGQSGAGRRRPRRTALADSRNRRPGADRGSRPILRHAAEARAAQPPALPKLISTSTGPMVLVPAGDFGFGGDKQRVSLPAFYIDQTEVTNADYARVLPGDQPPAAGPFPRGQARLSGGQRDHRRSARLRRVGRQAPAQRHGMGKGRARRRWPRLPVGQ